MPTKIHFSDIVDQDAKRQMEQLFAVDMPAAYAKGKEKIRAMAGELAKEAKSKTGPVDSTQIKEIEALKLQLNALKKKYTEITTAEQQYAKLSKTLASQETKNTAANLKLAASIKNLRTETRLETNEIAAQEGTIRKLQARTNSLVNKRTKLDLTTKEGRRQEKLYRDEIRRNTDQLKKYDAQIGRHQRNVGNYVSAFKNIGAALGITSGLFLAVNGIKRVIANSSKVLSEFGAEMSKFQAISDASANDMNRFREEAIKVASEFPQTAKQVAELGVEFSKLGFSTRETLDSLKGTVELSVATGENLADVADVVGSTVRAFGLSTKETQRVVDIAANSFASSALNLSRFRESMKYVAPVARQMGISVEYATAMLSKLADAGIRGSQAGTALRRILSEMGVQGRYGAEGLKDLAKAGISVAEANDEVGLRAQTALLVIADQKEGIDQLNESYVNVTKTAKEMAAVMQDNLLGDKAKRRSNWEAFIHELDTADGKISNLHRRWVQFTNGLVNGLKDWNKSDVELFLQYNGAEEQAEDLAKTLKSVSDSALKGVGEEYEETLKKRIESTAKRLNEFKQDFSEASYEYDNGSKSAAFESEGLNNRRNELLRTFKLQEATKKDLEYLNSLLDEYLVKKAEETDANTAGLGLIGELEEANRRLNTEKQASYSPERIRDINKEVESNEYLIKAIKARGDVNTYLAETYKELQKINYVPEDIGIEDIISFDESDIDKEIEASFQKTRSLFDRIESYYDGLKQKFGLISSKELFEKDLKELNKLLREQLISEEQFNKARTRLWMQHNQELINSSKQLYDSIGNAMMSYTSYALQESENQLSIHERAVSDLESRLDQEKQLKEEGKANDVELIRTQMIEEKKLRDKALKEKYKYQKQQAQIQLAMQAGNLITAATSIIAQETESKGIYGLVAGLAAVAGMIAAVYEYNAQIRVMTYDTPSYFDGTEDTGSGGNEDSKKGFPATLHPHERVVPEKYNKSLKGIRNDELPKLAAIHKNSFNYDLSGRGSQSNDYDKALLAEQKKQTKALEAIQNQPGQPVPLGDGTYIVQVGNETKRVRLVA